MTAARFCLALITPLALLAPGSGIAHAQANDMFPTKAAAEHRARELKCSGAFPMGDEWMPCKNFDAYEHALKKES